MKYFVVKQYRPLWGARSHLRSPKLPPSKTTPKDWIALFISILALIVSSLSAYWSVIREVDDVRVMILGHPNVKQTDAGIVVEPGDLRVGIVNLGNRPAAITHISVTLDQTKGKEDCLETSSEYTYLDVPPVIVEPGKIDVRISKFEKPSLLVSMSDENKSLSQKQ